MSKKQPDPWEDMMAEFEKAFLFGPGAFTATTATAEPERLPTFDELKATWDEIKPSGPVVVGMAISPRVAALIPPAELPNIALIGFGLPTIIDPRLEDKSEVYYDETAWKARCDEQRRWEAKTLPHKANV